MDLAQFNSNENEELYDVLLRIADDYPPWDLSWMDSYPNVAGLLTDVQDYQEITEEQRRMVDEEDRRWMMEWAASQPHDESLFPIDPELLPYQPVAPTIDFQDADREKPLLPQTHKYVSSAFPCEDDYHAEPVRLAEQLTVQSPSSPIAQPQSNSHHIPPNQSTERTVLRSLAPIARSKQQRSLWATPPATPCLNQHTTPNVTSITRYGVVRGKREDMTPREANITLMTIPVSAVEILTFFPHHTVWHFCTWRLINNGWTGTDIAAYKNYARDLTGDIAFLPTTTQNHIVNAHNGVVGKDVPRLQRAWTPVDDLSPAGWAPATHPKAHPPGLFDIYLAHVAKGVVHWPAEADAGAFTACVRYAVDNPYLQLKVSDVDNLVVAQSFSPLLSPNAQHDNNAFGRAKLLIKDKRFRNPRKA